MKHNQKGFGIVEIIIIIVLLGLVGWGAWYVWQASANKEAATNTSQSSSKEAHPTDSGTTASPATNEGFYEIKEWGIKIAIRDYDKVQFEVKNEGGTLLSGKTYDAWALPTFKPEFLQDKTCKPGIALYQSKTEFTPGNNESQKKIGDYYYAVTGAPGPCNLDREHPDEQLKTRFIQDLSNVQNISQL